jgi:hypothetical protein
MVHAAQRDGAYIVIAELMVAGELSEREVYGPFLTKREAAGVARALMAAWNTAEDERDRALS